MPPQPGTLETRSETHPPTEEAPQCEFRCELPVC